MPDGEGRVAADCGLPEFTGAELGDLAEEVLLTLPIELFADPRLEALINHDAAFGVEPFEGIECLPIDDHLVQLGVEFSRCLRCSRVHEVSYLESRQSDSFGFREPDFILCVNICLVIFLAK